jgi:hypothetical protein
MPASKGRRATVRVMENIATLHAWLATASAVLAVLLVLLGSLVGIGVVHSVRWLDRLIVAVMVSVATAGILGPLLFIAVAPPADTIHVLYAGVALLAAPVARLESIRRHSTRVGWWVAAGGLVTLGAVLRLWATGA